MSKKERKKIAGIVGICGVLSIITGCSQDTKTPVNTTTNIEITKPTQNTTSIQNTSTQQQLVIHPGCIGCGRCTMLAPNNFAMNGRQAEVISQENIDSPQVQQASTRCPVQVIEIIEV